MPDTKISLETASAALDGTEAIPAVKGAVNVRLSPAQIDTYASATTKTLTNKTLTSPVVNTPTGIVKGDVGLGNVDNTSNATERAATATLTNKTIAGASNTLTVREADLATTDVTTGDASTSKHGFLKKLSNSALDYMNGVGGWSVPAGGSGITVADTQVLFADGANNPAGDAGLVYNKTTNKLTTDGALEIDGDLLWSSHNSYNIGENGGNRPGSIFAANNLVSGGSTLSNLHFWLQNNGGGVTWGGSADVWLIRNAAGQLQTSLDATNSTYGSLRTIAEIVTKTASHTLDLTDVSKILEMNVGSANDLTVPANATVALPIGTIIDIAQIGAGQTTVVAAATVTISSKSGNLKLAGQWSGASLYKRATNTWVLTGDLVA